ITLDFTATVEEDSLARRTDGAPDSERVWRRQGRATTIADAAGVRTVEPRGSDVERMLAHFRDVVLGKSTPGITLDEAIDAMRTPRLAVEAVGAAGAPFERPNAPRHVSSRALQQPF